MKIGIKFIVIDSNSSEFEYVENAEYMFRDNISENTKVEVFIFTNNPINTDIKIVRERSLTEVKDIDGVKIIEDDNKDFNYVYLLPGIWNFNSNDHTILDKELETVRDFVSKYELLS